MIKLAILGFGVVGTGVADLFMQNQSTIQKNAGQAIELSAILDLRDLSDSPYHPLQVTDFSIIESDPHIQVVVECMGGKTAAYEFTKRALLAKKSVVTSNKELIAYHGPELFALAAQMGVHYLFEASVGGGTPIIRPIRNCLASNQLTEIYGILNGTTNFMLSQMEKEGATFKEALVQAQKRGYAESDPTADIEGHDAARKISILASLAFSTHIHPDSIATMGLSNVDISDILIAQQAGYSIKLLACSKVLKDGSFSVYVAPHLIENSQLLSQVDNVQNAVLVKGNALGEVLFYGPGAGAYPTASAILSDVISVVAGTVTPTLPWTSGTETNMADFQNLPQTWYIRCPKDKKHLFDCIKVLPSTHTTDFACTLGPISYAQLLPKLEEASAFCAIPLWNA